MLVKTQKTKTRTNMNSEKEQAEIAEAIRKAKLCCMQFVNLDGVEFTPETTLEILPIAVINQHRVIPINLWKNPLAIADDDKTKMEDLTPDMVTIAIDNLDKDEMATIRGLLPCNEVVFFLSTASAMTRALKVVDKLNADKLLLQPGM
jgi:hypothetical protein